MFYSVEEKERCTIHSDCRTYYKVGNKKIQKILILTSNTENNKLAVEDAIRAERRTSIRAFSFLFSVS